MDIPIPEPEKDGRSFPPNKSMNSGILPEADNIR
jgi:hypothetical protein